MNQLGLGENQTWLVLRQYSGKIVGTRKKFGYYLMVLFADHFHCVM